MKIGVLFIMTFLFASTAYATLSKDSAMVVMQNANKMYEASEYSNALEIYHGIASDYRSPILFYNMGNCYFKMGNIPEAILYYERSLKYDPENENTLANLAQANKLITDAIQAVPETAISQWWYGFTRNKSINFWANLSIYLMIGGFLILILSVIRTPSFVKKFSLLLGSLLVLSALFAFLLARTAKSSLENQEYAIIFTPKVDVTSEPKENGARQFVIHDGLKVKIIGENDDWFEIKLVNGAIGWIKKSDCKVI